MINCIAYGPVAASGTRSRERGLAKHVSTSHLKITETKCNVPGCNAVLSKEEPARHRHVLTVHRSAAA